MSNNQLQEFNDKIEELTTLLKNAKNEIKELDKELVAANDNIDDLERDLSDAEETIEELEVKLDDFKYGTNMNTRTISYGQTEDEKTYIISLDDESRFKTCMKLYKLYNSTEKLEGVIKKKALKLIENSI